MLRYSAVESFRRLSIAKEDTRYALTLVPRIALLAHTKGSGIFLNQSVTDVVGQVLRKHGLEGADFEFRLSREYPARALITQWRETDLAFVQRLLAEVGIYWRVGRRLVYEAESKRHRAWFSWRLPGQSLAIPGTCGRRINGYRNAGL
ncbi:contractile injection system protein, VgrG/Pvc8 family [Martelella alba]|uniref:contractile injection system protein, VgrG/Pvc8 family n=1 Tax=Martelella alba TaxID=2590451 RepID=UPI001E42725A|nr:contractile injection system protein, VgrG/Pvc8 family [Martelella alba]